MGVFLQVLDEHSHPGRCPTPVTTPLDILGTFTIRIRYEHIHTHIYIYACIYPTKMWRSITHDERNARKESARNTYLPAISQNKRGGRAL